VCSGIPTADRGGGIRRWSETSVTRLHSDAVDRLE
jgi:hypothetical protein